MAEKAQGGLALPREFSKTKEQIDEIQARAKAHPEVKDQSDLKKEVEMDEHKISPLEGIQGLAAKFHFAPPPTLEHHMNNGLSKADAEVGERENAR